MKLSKDAFMKAREFVFSEGRPVDQALFSYAFENGAAEAVINAVAAYQNEDGGFGHCLEPDFRLHASSVMATTVGFQYLRAVDAPVDHPVIVKAIEYLLEILDPESMTWPPVPVEVDVVARAPWWTHAIWDGRGEEEWANPNAECLAILTVYSDHVPADLLRRLADTARARLAKAKRPAEMHDFLCWLGLSRVAPSPLKEEIEKYLTVEVSGLVGKDEAAWESYGLRPYWVVEDASDALYPALKTALSANLDYEIAHQQENGAWTPSWAWGQFEESWKVARREWSGHLTVKLLRRLRTFDRLE